MEIARPPRLPIAVFGAAGYSGLELLKLVEMHPQLHLAVAASDANAGKPIASMTGRTHRGDPVFATTAAARAVPVEAALLAVPPEAAVELAPELLAAGVRVVDLSNAYRARPDDAHYGITSLASIEAPRAARLIANPGCYATCAITAAAPLVGLVDGAIAIAAGSGVTGAGRKADEALSLGEMYGEVRAYRVLKHQHVPEIVAALGGQRIVLTTHLLPIARGIFMTLTATLTAPVPDLLARYRERYAGDPTVVVQPTAEDVTLRRVVGTAQCHVGVAVEDRTVVVTAALDNLMKGAASQAVENLNLMLGLPRMAGLQHVARHA